MSKINTVPDWRRVEHVLEEARFSLLLLADGYHDPKALRAMCRCIEIIGEATNAISRDTWEKYPHIPWRDLVNMRNRLIHGYDGVIPNILWENVRKHIPTIIEQMQHILVELKTL
jgi:uncharacterized protein with HEPN domain